MDSIYVETSIISYLVARPTHDVVAAAKRSITRRWWTNNSRKYDLYLSELVLAECARGDREAARLRVAIVRELQLLVIDDECLELAKMFFEKAQLPENARSDALHVAVATRYGLDFLLTWNCRHLANAHFIRRLDQISREEGVIVPTICTPEEIGNAEQRG